MSLAPSAYAQTSIRPPVVVSAQAGIINTPKICVEDLKSHSQNPLRARMPNSISLTELRPSESPQVAKVEFAKSENVVRRPMDATPNDWSNWPLSNRANVNQKSESTARQIKVKPIAATKKLEANESNDSILVDPAIFEENAKQLQSIRQLTVREVEPPAAYNFPNEVSSIKTSPSQSPNHQSDLAQAQANSAQQHQALPSVSHASTPAAYDPDRFNHQQVSATLQPLDRFAIAAIPTTMPTPIAIANRRNWSRPKKTLPTISTITKPSTLVEAAATKAAVDETEASQQEISIQTVKAPKFDIESEFAPVPVSLFVEGPDYLKVNQSGDYEIAVVNSSSESTSVSEISLGIPATAEMLVIGREGQINQAERTLTWSIDELASGQQQRIRFRLRVVAAGNVDFPVTVSQNGHKPQTISQATSVK